MKIITFKETVRVPGDPIPILQGVEDGSEGVEVSLGSGQQFPGRQRVPHAGDARLRLADGHGVWGAVLLGHSHGGDHFATAQQNLYSLLQFLYFVI